MRTTSHTPLYLALIASTVLTSAPVQAGGGGVPINYDGLSFFEVPLAVDILGATLSGNFLADQAAQYNFRSNKDTYNTRLQGQALLETQLPNSWRVGMQYFGGYNRLASDKYTDNVAAFIADEWGTLAAGDVTGSVFEDMRRRRGVGNAALANDNFFGGLDTPGGYYRFRYNSFVTSLTADREGRAEIGVSFERPIGTGSYFFSTRARKGHTSVGTISAGRGDTYGGAVVGAYQYGSFRIDGQLGYETIELDLKGTKKDHRFSSLGLYYKYGAYSFSAEGGLGEYNNTLKAAALGTRVDVARGTSLNFGVNYSNPNQKSTTTALGSIRYEF